MYFPLRFASLDCKIYLPVRGTSLSLLSLSCVIMIRKASPAAHICLVHRRLAPFWIAGVLFSFHFARAFGTMSKSKIDNVIVSIAMEDEAKPFIDHLGLKVDENFFPKQAPFHAFVGSYKDCQITVVTAGKDSVHDAGVDNVGTVPAAVATFLALQKLDSEADLLINAGTCGGFRSMGAEIGDCFLTTGVVNHDRRIPIPAFEPYGTGFIKSVSVPQLKKEIGAKEGICTTGNSLDMHDVDELHIKKNGASVKDMEAAAIGWAAELFNMPHFGVKVVTDIVDGSKPTQEEFFENLGKAAESLQSTLPKVIEYVCGKAHDEL